MAPVLRSANHTSISPLSSVRFGLNDPMDVLITADQIRDRVDELAADDPPPTYAGKPFTVVGILTGCLVFLADLIRRIDLPLQIGLVQASSYRGTATSPGELVIRDELLPDVARPARAPARRHPRHRADAHPAGRAPAATGGGVGADVRAAAQGRPAARCRSSRTSAGSPIPDKFVVGYGLDYNDEYRHLPFIGVLPDGTA